jgi:hypothetical protein
MISKEAQQTVEVVQVAVSPADALMQTLKAVGNGRVLVYAKCPVTGAHHCIGRLKRVRVPFHTVPLIMVYKRSLGRGKGFESVAESPLVPTGIYLEVRQLLKRYVGFASGVKGFAGSSAGCVCGKVMGPALEKVRFRDGKVRFHLSFSCAGCGRVSRPWMQHYLDRFAWLVRRAKTMKILRSGGLRCRACGEKALRARVTGGDPTSWSTDVVYSRFILRCGNCGFTVAPPCFTKSKVADEVLEVEETER